MLIRNGTVWSEEGSQTADVRLEEGLVVQVAPGLSPEPGEEVFDAAGLHLLPGAVDLHFNLADEEGKSCESTGRALVNALEGGITTAVVPPHMIPMVDGRSAMKYLHSLAEESGGADVKACASATVKGKGEVLSNLSLLLKAGAAAVWTESDMDGNVLRRACEYGKMAGKPLVVRCRNRAMEGAGVMHEGAEAAKMGLPGMPRFAETSEGAKVAEIGAGTGCAVVLQSLSAKESLEVVKRGKERGDKLYATVDLPHLLLTDAACREFDTMGKTLPPLREETDRKALLEGVKSGLVDAVVSNHQAQDLNAKDTPFELAGPGIATASYFLSLFHTELVASGELTLADYCRLCAVNPAGILGLEDRGRIAPGKKGDLVLFDPAAEWKLDREALPGPAANTPWLEKTLRGKVVQLFLGQGAE